MMLYPQQLLKDGWVANWIKVAAYAETGFTATQNSFTGFCYWHSSFYCCLGGTPIIAATWCFVI